VLNSGIVEQLGSPRSLYDDPQSRFVADFMGSSNIFDIDEANPSSGIVTVNGINLLIQNSEALNDTNRDHAVIIRPERIAATSEAVLDADNCLRGRIIEAAFLGPMILILAEVPLGTLNVK